tara:strand:- start:863 stop:1255 length:393 start_codon:yes stop_codon:yes gene_type:complete
MLEQITIYLASIILGIMIFFSFVVAPITFKSLNEENARVYIRTIFPYYYNLNLIISLLILSILLFLNLLNTDFYLILSISILFAVSNYILMPLINKFRDENKDKKFKISHFTSVIINFLQMILLAIVLFN